MNVVCLTEGDRRLLVERFAQHGNSSRNMCAALRAAGTPGMATRLEALRKLEHCFRIDLASVCHRFERRELPATHPIERMVMRYITQLHARECGDELWVLLDRVEEIRELMEGRLVS